MAEYLLPVNHLLILDDHAVAAADTNTINDDASVQVVLGNKDSGDSDSNSDDE